MADAFRGLTLRLGADARPVQSAISSITRSASQAQSQLNKLNRALKLDPGNIAVMAERIDLIGDKGAHAARGLVKVKAAMRQASAEAKQLASSTSNVYAKTQQLNSAYNHTSAELQQIYDAAKRALLANKDYAKINTWEKANKFVNALRRNLDEVGDKGKRANAILQSLIRSAAFRTDITGAFGLEQNIGAASKLIPIWKRLRAEHKSLQTELARFKEAEGLHALRIQALTFAAELRQDAAEAARVRSELYALGANAGIAKAVSHSQRLNAVLERTRESSRAMTASFNAMPKSVAAATMKLNATASEVTALNAKLNALVAVLKRLDGENFDKLAAKTRNVWAATDKAEANFAQIEEKVRRATAALERLNSEFNELKKKNGDKTTDQMVKLQARIQNVTNALARMGAAQREADTVMRSSRAAQTYRETYEEIQRVKAALAQLQARTSALANIARTARTAGYGLYSTLTPTLMILGRYAINSANDVDTAYRNMRKTVQGTELEFENLRKAALEFGRTHFTSADKILEIEAVGGQLGIMVQNLQKFSEVVSNTDIATNMDTETIAENFGQLSNIMKDMNQDIEEGPGSLEAFSDSLVRLGNNSAAQEDKIMKVMMRVASIGTISGMATPELLALSTAVAAAGQGSEAAGTAISRTFSQIEMAVGKGGEKLELFAKTAGKDSASEFAEAWKTSPMEAFKDFIEGLKKIDDAGGSVSNRLSELGINAVRQRQTLMNLTNTTDVLSNALVMSQNAWDGVGDQWGAAGDAAREAARKSEGFSGQLQIAKNAAQELGVILLDSSVPLLKFLTGCLQMAADNMSKLSGSAKTGIVMFGLTAAALGPLLVAFGAIVNGAMTMGKAFNSAVSMMRARKSIITEVDTALAKNSASIAKVTAAEKRHQMALGESSAALANHRAQLEAERAQLLETQGALNRSAAAASKLKTALKGIGYTAGFMVILEVVGQIISKIQEAINKANEFKNATGGLRDATDNLIASAKQAGNASDEMFGTDGYDHSQEYIKIADEAISKNVELKNAMEATKKAEESSISVVTDYADRMSDLNGQCNGNAEKLSELKSLVASFNKVTGASVSIVNNQTGELSVGNDVLAKNVELIKKKQHLESVKKSFTNASSTYAEQKAALEKLNAELEKYRKLANSDTADSWILDYAGGQMRVIQEQIDKLKPVVDAAKDTYDKTFAEYAKSTSEMESATNEFGDSLNDTGADLTKFAGDVEEASEEVQKAEDSFNELLDKFPEFASAFGNMDATSFLTLLEQMGLSIEDVGKDMDALVEKVSNGFNQIEVDSEMSLQKYIDNLQHNIQVTRDWGNDLETLYDKSTDPMYQAWVKSVADMGPEQAQLVAQMAKMSYDELVEYANKWVESQDTAAKSGMQSMGLMSEGARDLAANLSKVAEKPVEIEVTDNGTMKLTQEELATIDRFEFAKKGFIVSDDGTIIDMTEKCESLNMVKIDGKYYWVSDNGTIYDEKGKVVELAGELSKLKDVNIKVNADDTPFQRVMNEVHSRIESLGGFTIPITSNGGKFASGGVSWKEIARIPMHASGAINGIVTRPTLTNIGWTGEAGAEAILHMKNAGGMVVPLTNRRYVRPFARAVAGEMGYSGQSVQHVTNIYIDGVQALPDSRIYDVSYELATTILDERRA